MRKYIWQVLIIFLGVISITACATISPSAPPLFRNSGASMAFSDPDIIWQYVGATKINGAKARIFVPANETQDDWSKKIFIAYAKNRPPEQVNAYEFYLNTVVDDFNVQCAESTSDIHILKQSDVEVEYLYQMYKCGKYPNQIAVGRIVESKRSVSSIKYVVKADQLTLAQKEAMFDLVKKAWVIKD